MVAVDLGKMYLYYSNIFVYLKSLVVLRTYLLAFGWVAVTSESLETGILKWCGERS